MPVLRHLPLQAAGPHDQVDRAAVDYAVQTGASRWEAWRPGLQA